MRARETETRITIIADTAIRVGISPKNANANRDAPTGSKRLARPIVAAGK
jgi:hypothetical protein